MPVNTTKQSDNFIDILKERHPLARHMINTFNDINNEMQQHDTLDIADIKTYADKSKCVIYNDMQMWSNIMNKNQAKQWDKFLDALQTPSSELNDKIEDSIFFNYTEGCTMTLDAYYRHLKNQVVGIENAHNIPLFKIINQIEQQLIQIIKE